MKLAAALIVATSAAGVATNELPIGDWSKLGVSGICLGIVLILLLKVIPNIVDKHAESWKEIGGKVDGVREAIDRGNERLIDAFVKRE